MCGIGGVVGVEEQLALPAAQKMLAALRQRGRDGEGLKVIVSAAQPYPLLVHTRLAITDLTSLANQPMVDAPLGTSRPNHVTFNGELYNFRELAADVARSGWHARTRSDAEVLLHAYRVWGIEAAKRFEGMFAFGLVDVDRGLLWLCRDRVGMKPVYFARVRGGGLLFASELRALLAVGAPLVRAKLDRSGLEAFLAQGSVYGEQAIVRDIQLLAPGQSLLCDLAGAPLKSVRYWSVGFGAQLAPPSNARQVAEPSVRRSRFIEELSSTLRRSLRNVSQAEVPAGIFLSSGIDSSCVATLAAECAGHPIRTVCLGFDQAVHDESDAAAGIAAELGAQHTRARVSAEGALGSLDEVLAAMDQPTIDGFNVFHVSRAAHQAGIRVALSGLGGDELFGGYATFRDVPRGLRASRIARPLAVPCALARRLLSVAPSGLKSRGLAKLLELPSRGDVASLYFLRRELFLPPARRALHELPSGSEPVTGMSAELIESLHGTSGRDILDQVAQLEFSCYMRHALLRDLDVFSLAQGVEVRAPLLEHYVVEHAARAESAWRRPDPRPKPLLIDATGPKLPNRVLRQPKHGFMYPWEGWLNGRLARRVTDAVHSRDTWRNIGLEPDVIRQTWRRFQAGDPSVSALQIVAVVVLEHFCRVNRVFA